MPECPSHTLPGQDTAAGSTDSGLVEIAVRMLLHGRHGMDGPGSPSVVPDAAKAGWTG